MNTPRDGLVVANGLTAEFRFLSSHPSEPNSYIDTAAGPMWARDEWLVYDPIRDLTPEAAALVEQAQVTP